MARSAAWQAGWDAAASTCPNPACSRHKAAQPGQQGEPAQDEHEQHEHGETAFGEHERGP